MQCCKFVCNISFWVCIYTKWVIRNESIWCSKSRATGCLHFFCLHSWSSQNLNWYCVAFGATEPWDSCDSLLHVNKKNLFLFLLSLTLLARVLFMSTCFLGTFCTLIIWCYCQIMIRTVHQANFKFILIVSINKLIPTSLRLFYIIWAHKCYVSPYE